MEVISATPLYEFLRHCNNSALEKNVLDCGAGGKEPPLSLFNHYGYKTFGVEIAEESLVEAQGFCREHQLLLNIFRGDMRRLPFAGQTFSFAYCFNAIFFMTKPDIEISMKEIERVLLYNGLCYVNFLSVDDPDNRTFCTTAPTKRLLKSERFAKHEDDEAERYFYGFEILRKEKRIIDRVWGNEKLRQVIVEYIAKKKKMSGCPTPVPPDRQVRDSNPRRGAF
jgi:ubiquinone/menaquinone biosynthesis C-methylase UbiE